MRYPTRLVVELDRGAPEVTGRRLPTSGEAHPFRGWLGLISALDAEISPGAARAEGARSRRGATESAKPNEEST
jgi:hypothetical protein